MSVSVDPGEKCRIVMRLNPFLPNHNQHDTDLESLPVRDQLKIPWCACVTLDVLMTDLPRLQQQGLFWTADNILLPTAADHTDGPQDRGSLLRASLKHTVRRDDIFGPVSFKFAWPTKEIRSWRLQEHPDRPVDESRWTGRINLFAHDWASKTMAEFDFNQLTRRHIYAAFFFGAYGQKSFTYIPPDPSRDGNRLSERLATDIWWLWPMESIVTPLPPLPPPRNGNGSLSGGHGPTLRRRVPQPGIHARRDDELRGIEGQGQIDKPDCCGCRCTHHYRSGSSQVQMSGSEEISDEQARILRRIAWLQGKLGVAGLGFIFYAIISEGRCRDGVSQSYEEHIYHTCI